MASNTEEEIFIVLVGSGGTGKSTFLSALLSTFGDYGRTAQFSTFLRNSNNRAARDDLMDLFGARLVVASESNKKCLFDEALLKSITSSGDRIRARHLYARSVEFSPSWLTILSSNHLPNFNMTDSGMRRRIRVLPFEGEIIPDPVVKRELTSGLHDSAILNWCIEGLSLYREEGLGSDFMLKETPWNLFG